MSVHKEEWRAILGFEGFYEVSNHGRVRSLKRPVMCRNGRQRTTKPKILQPNVNKCKKNRGYQCVTLSTNEKPPRKHYIHRLVATAFLDNPETDQHVNHMDGDTYNNNVSNLEWCTPSDNQKHAYLLGLKSTRSKLTFEDVGYIRALRKDKFRVKDIAYAFNVSPAIISNICRGRTRKYA